MNYCNNFSYAKVLMSLLAPHCIYLLDTFDYDPNEYPGPPHFVSEDLVKQLYGTIRFKKSINFHKNSCLIKNFFLFL